jgi:glycosyltransferase involved in cell wall biosynthesis
MLHLAWADRDWGYLDLALSRNRTLIGTFHACPDDFFSTVSRPRRLKNLAAVILMSEVQRENFVKAGMRPERIHVIHHGIDTKHFVPAEPKPEPSNKFTVLHVGSYRRNFDDLEAVCDKLSNSPNIRIKIITSPKIGARFANKPNVEVVSGLSDAELLKAYQDADCLLMTAETATANNAILEGIACGLPVVTQRVGGIPEYVNKDCAFLCEAGDSDALVNALERLQADLDLRSRMGRAARARALELDWVHVAAKTQAVYDQVLAERHQ